MIAMPPIEMHTIPGNSNSGIDGLEKAIMISPLTTRKLEEIAGKKKLLRPIIILLSLLCWINVAEKMTNIIRSTILDNRVSLTM